MRTSFTLTLISKISKRGEIRYQSKNRGEKSYTVFKGRTKNNCLVRRDMAITHTTAFKFCRSAHLLNKLLMSKINLHISSNFCKLLWIGKRCFQPEVAKSSKFLCFIN